MLNLKNLNSASSMESWNIKELPDQLFLQMELGFSFKLEKSNHKIM